MIVTFYSFKGGVGRSMALANVAEILASRGYRVIACDWDLEAPGLERYLVASELPDYPYGQELADYKGRPGLIDLLLEYKKTVSEAAPAVSRDAASPTAAEPPAPLPSGHFRLGPIAVRRPSTRVFPVTGHATG